MKIKKEVILILVTLAIIIAIIFIFLKTGLYQVSAIDDRDLERWNYTNGLIDKSQEFTIEGDKKTCWLLIHSYTSTPDEMRRLAARINFEFNDHVLVPRLQGHGEVPSKILNLRLNDWYDQIEQEYETLNAECEKVNVAGSSIGGAMTLRLAQEKELNNVYPINAYLFSSYTFSHITNPQFYIDLLGSVIIYYKKSNAGGIADPEGLKEHIVFFNFPFPPITNSRAFFEQTQKDLNKITEPILIQHSRNDKTASFQGSEIAFKDASSEDKEFIKYTRSDHILLRDFDKESTVQNIIDFERARRDS